ncbi:hypothetical protein BCD67_03470 [Oscillatoriales cyanobacterium USR001]|nr:hypothetical protein BCD67_03470 [Oscillatoriales cyanobacterium USR001]
MGLAEKQLVTRIKDQRVPYFQGNLQTNVGKDIAIEVLWENIESDLEALKVFESTGLEAIVAVLSKISRKAGGKEAISDSISTVRLINETDSSAKKVTLENGVLSIHAAWGKGFNGRYADTDLIKEIEKLL